MVPEKKVTEEGKTSFGFDQRNEIDATGKSCINPEHHPPPSALNLRLDSNLH